MVYDVVIIGGGLGGLQCGYILTRKGLNVCVLEKERQPGGCLQTFRRGSAVFDTGFHYVGGLDEGQPLYLLMKYYDLLGLDWHRLDSEGFDEVVMDGERYPFPMGHEPFADAMSHRFPHQRKNLERYTELLRKVGSDVFRVIENRDESLRDFYTSLFARPAYGYLQECFDDPLLIQVLSGASLKMEPDPEKLPLYTFAQTNESYIESAWRLKGGGAQMAETLANGIRGLGGTVLTGQKVVELQEYYGRITAAVLQNGEYVAGRTFISNIHPAATLELLGGSSRIRPSYRKRLNQLENTFGMFTVNIRLKENTLPYLNRNLHIHSEPDVWSHSRYIPERKGSYVFASWSVPERDGRYAENIDLLLPMYWEEVSRWSDTRVGRRGEEYGAFKEAKAQEAISLAAQYIPGLREAIDKYYTSTPLTWRDYTGTANGSAYGIRKDYNNLTYTMLSSKTPIGNLLLTGQNLSVHGIMGVSMTALLTCAQILGSAEIEKDFYQRNK